MLAYAAHRGQRRNLSPATLSLIIGAHAVALGLLITAKMSVDAPPSIVRTLVENIPLPQGPPPPPPPEPMQQTPAPAPLQSTITRPPAVIDTPAPGPTVDVGPPTLTIAPDIGPVIEQPLKPPAAVDPPREPVKIAARLSTPADLLRPPYPETKRRLEEEATLRLRLSIDERGRVTAVDAVGAADQEFLASARKHIIRNWRYKPATEDGRAVPATLVITLRFELDDA